MVIGKAQENRHSNITDGKHVAVQATVDICKCRKIVAYHQQCSYDLVITG